MQILGHLDKRESFKQGVLSGPLKPEAVGGVESAYIIGPYIELDPNPKYDQRDVALREPTPG